jgi:predicted ATP-grasp superfamily ATP-dependent carboligase
MTLFVSEYICSGALIGRDLPTSLLREGQAMRDAVIADLAALPDVAVTTTCDRRVPPPASKCKTLVVLSPDLEQQRFSELCEGTDAALVIAPELGGVLLDRCRVAAELSPRLLNCTPAAVELCSDKFALWERLQSAGVPTIPTALADGTPQPEFPVVVKPRFGAGSQSTFLCRTDAELQGALLSYRPEAPPEQQPIVQPYVEGRALSVALLCSGSGEPMLLPAAEQRLSDDGRFSYLGGRIPAAGIDHGSPIDVAIRALAADASRIISGLHGYVGLDLLLPTAQPDRPLLVEINPRLTTSYVGYRALCRENLGRFLLGGPAGPVLWRDRAVTFSASGEVSPSPPPARRRSSGAPRSPDNTRHA